MATNREKLVAAAQKLVEKGQFEKAIKEYLKAVADDDNDVRIWLKIGDLYAKIAKREEAIEVYQKVARFYSDQGFYLKAVAVYKQILKLDPRLVGINIKLAELYKQLGLLSDAIGQYEVVANQLNRDGKQREALAAFKQIVELDPDNVDNRTKLAELYSRENMVREAVDEFAHAAEQLHERKRWDEYLRVAERLLFFNTDNRPVSREVARLYIERGDPRKALPRLQACFKADPRDNDTLWLLARAFEALEQIPKAVTVLRELARIHAEGQDSRARDEAYRKILQLSPGDPEAEQALSGKARGGYAQPHAEPAVVVRTPAPAYARQNTPLPEEPTHVHPANAAAATANTAADDEAITKILNETDVYIKYKLFPKAIEHVQKIFERDPKNLLAREKLKALYVSVGRTNEAIDELWRLHDQSKGRRYLREIIELDPHNDRALTALREMPATTPAPRAAAPARNNGAGAHAAAPSAETSFADVDDDVEELDDEEFVESHSYEEGAFVVEPSEPTHDPVEDVTTGVVDPNRFLNDSSEVGSDVDDDLIPLVVEAPAESTNTAQVSIIEDRFALPEDSSNDLARELPPLASVAKPAAATARPAPRASEDHDVHTRFEDPLSRFGADVASDADGDAISEMDDLPPSPVSGRHAVPAASPVENTRQVPFPTDEPREGDDGFLPASNAVGMEDELEEANFFLQQSLLTDARGTLETLLAKHPNHPLVLGKLAEVASARAERDGGPPANSATPSEPDPVAELAPSPTQNTPRKRAVVEKGVDAEDFETHYDLGIAYKEMGLLDDAIAEFRTAMQAPKKEVQCLLMLGLCYLEKSQPSEAVSQFKKGLYVETINDRESLTLYFELGQAYEQMHDVREALYYFEKVSKREAKFRDVDKKLAQLHSGQFATPQQKPDMDEMDFDGAIDALAEK